MASTIDEFLVDAQPKIEVLTALQDELNDWLESASPEQLEGGLELATLLGRFVADQMTALASNAVKVAAKAQASK